MSLSMSIVCASIGNTQQLTVDARQLHHTLEVKRDFSNWIKGRIEKFLFKENEDFIIFANSGEKSSRGRNAIEYRLTLDMAKELAMVENNERGRMVRRYFIECERRLKEGPAQPAAPVLSTVEDRRPLNTIVRAWAQQSGQKYSMCWKQVNEAFQLQSAAELPAAWVADAVAWVKERMEQTLPTPQPFDLYRTDAISLAELVDVLNRLAYRMEKTCHTMTEEEWKAGCEFFFRAAEVNSPDAAKHFTITNALSATLVGPLFTTLDLVRAAATMASKARRMHDIVCGCK